MPGSVAVKEGDVVTTGQLLGKLGSTGNSTAPHLHFGLGDEPDILSSNSIPFVIDRYKYVGTADVNTVIDAFTTGAPLGLVPGDQARIQRNAHPLNFAITDYK
jgi:murein DD-endopeptidase MepM/ murein hydrolase activator NlpD